MNTMQFLSRIGHLTCAILLMGCPYSAEFPLSEPTLKAAESFVGIWEEEESKGNTITIARGAGNIVAITKTDAGYDGAEPTITKYSGHITDINGTSFINVKEDGDFGVYYFYKLTKDGDAKIVLAGVTSYIRESFTNSAEMKKYFTDNMQNSYFFETGDVTYVKIK